jgi:hypothetical protein
MLDYVKELGSVAKGELDRLLWLETSCPNGN